MRKLFAILTAVVLVASFAPVASAQTSVNPFVALNPISGSVTSATVGEVAFLVKYVGSTAGKPTVEVSAGGDITFKIAGAADTTTGESANGVFDLSTPAAGVDTMGELCTLINTTGSNWRCVLMDSLASDITDAILKDITATDASGPKGVALNVDNTVALRVQAALVPPGVNTDISYFLPVRVGAKINPNAFSGFQSFLQMASETITSSGTIAQFSVLGVTRTYDSNGKVSDTVRQVYSQLGGATTARSAIDTGFAATPIASAPGEFFIVRQITATDLTVVNVNAVGYMVKTPKP